MSGGPGGPVSSERPHTITRLRFVAPPGMALEEGVERKQIGRYEIMQTLGKGAMGVVYKARDPLLDRIVAVKTLVSPKGGGKRVKKAYLERFEREAKAAAKMQHPAIVTIFDVGLDDTGVPYMVLEYLPGESLADRLDKVRLPLGKAVQISLDLASALSFAHKQRIVHRDVKPANVLHAGEGRWKLADFGIARMPDSDLTQVGIFMGTPGYAPPEAIGHGKYTPQADVFAWGAVLYELLSGRIPYEGPDTRTTNGYVLKAAAKNPRDWDKSIPSKLSQVVMTAIDPSTNVRYADGAAAEAALKQAWDYCIERDLIKVQSLAGPEVPHGHLAASQGMHHTNPDPAFGEGSATADDSLQSFAAYSVEDEPTKIMSRPASPVARKKTGITSDPGNLASLPTKDIESPRPAGVLNQVQRGNPTTVSKEANGAWRWVVAAAILLVALAAGAAAAYFLLDFLTGR